MHFKWEATGLCSGGSAGKSAQEHREWGTPPFAFTASHLTADSSMNFPCGQSWRSSYWSPCSSAPQLLHPVCVVWFIRHMLNCEPYYEPHQWAGCRQVPGTWGWVELELELGSTWAALVLLKNAHKCRLPCWFVLITSGLDTIFLFSSFLLPLSLPPSLSPSLPLTHTYSLSHSHTHSLTHTLIHSHTHFLTHTYSYSLSHTHSVSLTHCLMHTHTLSLILSHSLFLTHSLPHTLCLFLTHTHTFSLSHPLTLCLFLTQALCLSHTFSHSHTLSLSHTHTHSLSLSLTTEVSLGLLYELHQHAQCCITLDCLGRETGVYLLLITVGVSGL